MPQDLDTNVFALYNDPSFAKAPQEEKASFLSDYFDKAVAPQLAGMQGIDLPDSRSRFIKAHTLQAGYDQDVIGLLSSDRSYASAKPAEKERFLGDLFDKKMEGKASYVDADTLKSNRRLFIAQNLTDADRGEVYSAIGGLGRMAQDLPRQVVTSVSQAARGAGGGDNISADGKDYTDKSRAIKSRDDAVRRAEYGGNALLDNEKVNMLGAGESAGFSATGGVMTTAAGLATGGLGLLAGGAISGGIAFSGQRDEYLASLVDRVNDELQAAGKDRMSQAQQNELTSRFSTEATKYGAWEAGPEALGNIVGGAVIGKLVKGIVGKSLLQRAAKGTAALAGDMGIELAGETVTGKMQAPLDVLSGAREKDLTWAEAFKEQAPTTLAMFGSGHAIGVAGGKAAKGLGLLPTDPRPVTEKGGEIDMTGAIAPEQLALPPGQLALPPGQRPGITNEQRELPVGPSAAAERTMAGWTAHPEQAKRLLAEPEALPPGQQPALPPGVAGSTIAAPGQQAFGGAIPVPANPGGVALAGQEPQQALPPGSDAIVVQDQGTGAPIAPAPPAGGGWAPSGPVVEQPGIQEALALPQQAGPSAGTMAYAPASQLSVPWGDGVSGQPAPAPQPVQAPAPIPTAKQARAARAALKAEQIASKVQAATQAAKDAIERAKVNPALAPEAHEAIQAAQVAEADAQVAQAEAVEQHQAAEQSIHDGAVAEQQAQVKAEQAAEADAQKEQAALVKAEEQARKEQEQAAAVQPEQEAEVAPWQMTLRDYAGMPPRTPQIMGNGEVVSDGPEFAKAYAAKKIDYELSVAKAYHDGKLTLDEVRLKAPAQHAALKFAEAEPLPARKEATKRKPAALQAKERIAAEKTVTKPAEASTVQTQTKGVNDVDGEHARGTGPVEVRPGHEGGAGQVFGGSPGMADGQGQPKRLAEGAGDFQTAVGEATTVLHTDGEDAAHYEIREAAELLPSHDSTRSFVKNEAYPAFTQERAYHTDKDEQQKVIFNATTINPRLHLTDNPDAVNGPAVITSSGLVLGGNSRVMSLQYVYEKNPQKADLYIAALTKKAEHFGIDPKILDQFQAPVLVRVLEDAERDTKALAKLVRVYNQNFTQEIDARAEAVSKGRLLSQESMDIVGHALEGFDSIRDYLGNVRSKALIESLLQDGVVEKTQLGRITTKETGLLNEEGKSMIERVMRGKALNDFDLVSALAPAMQAKLDRMISSMTIIQARGEKWNIIPQLNRALWAHVKYAASDAKTMEAFWNQRSIFEEDNVDRKDDVTSKLFYLMGDPSPKAVERFWKDYAKAAAASPKGQAALPGGMAATPESAMESLSKRALPKMPKAEPHLKVNTTTTGRGYPIEKVQAIVAHIAERWAGMPPVQVVQTVGEMLELTGAQIPEGTGGIISGIYHKGIVYVVADAALSAQDVANTVAHEVLRHHGLRLVLGDAYERTMKQAWSNPAVQAKAIELGKQGYGWTEPELAASESLRIYAADEAIAHLGDAGIKGAWFDRAVQAVQKWLRKIGLLKHFTNADVRTLITDSSRAAREGTAGVERIEGVPTQAGAASPEREVGRPNTPRPSVMNIVRDSVGVKPDVHFLRRTSEANTDRQAGEEALRAGMPHLDDKKGQVHFVDTLKRMAKNSKGQEAKELSGFARRIQQAWWMAKKHPIVRELLDAQTDGEEGRHAGLHEVMDGTVKAVKGLNDKAMAQLTSIIHQLDGKNLTGVTTSKFLGKKLADGSTHWKLNDEHYTQLKAVLLAERVSADVADAYVAIRRGLDTSLVHTFHKMQALRIDANLIDRFRSHIGHIQNYFPHMRFGDHYINVKDAAGETIYNEHVDGKMALAAAQLRIEKMYPEEHAAGNITSGKISGNPESVFENGINTANISQIIEQALAKSDMASVDVKEKVRRELSKQVADVLLERGWGQHAMKRKNVAGYEKQDVGRVLAAYHSGHQGWLHKVEKAQRFAKIISSMNAKADSKLYDWAKQFSRDMLRNQDATDRIVAKARTAMSVWYIGGRVSTAFTNLTQNLILGVPTLSQHIGLMGASRNYIQNAVRSVAYMVSGEKSRGEHMRAGELAFLEDFHQRGITEANFMHEIAGLDGDSIDLKTRSLVRLIFVPFTIAEHFNRVSLALAAYRAARDGKIVNPKTLEKYGKKRGERLSEVDARDFAREVTLDSHFLTGKANLPEIVRGSARMVATPAYTFRGYQHGLISAWRHMLTGQGREGKAAFAYSLAATIAVGGLKAMPMFALLSAAMTGLGGDDWDRDLYKGLRDILGDKGADMSMYGVGALGDITLAPSMGMDLPILSELRSDKPVGEQVMQKALGAVLGVPVALIEQGFRAAHFFNLGNTYRGMETLAPAFVAGPIRAYRFATEGATTASGRPQAIPGTREQYKMDAGEAAKQSLGFTPLAKQKMYDAQSSVQRLEQYRAATQEKLIARYVQAKKSGSQDAIDAVLSDQRAHNTKMREDGHPGMVIQHLAKLAREHMKMQKPSKRMKRELRGANAAYMGPGD